MVEEDLAQKVDGLVATVGLILVDGLIVDGGGGENEPSDFWGV